MSGLPAEEVAFLLQGIHPWVVVRILHRCIRQHHTTTLLLFCTLSDFRSIQYDFQFSISTDDSFHYACVSLFPVALRIPYRYDRTVYLDEHYVHLHKI